MVCESCKFGSIYVDLSGTGLSCVSCSHIRFRTSGASELMGTDDIGAAGFILLVAVVMTFPLLRSQCSIESRRKQRPRRASALYSYDRLGQR